MGLLNYLNGKSCLSITLLPCSGLKVNPLLHITYYVVLIHSVRNYTSPIQLTRLLQRR